MQDLKIPTVIVEKIVSELDLNPKQVYNTLKLLLEGATVPFISRYRKELTGSLDEVIIINIRNLYEKLLEVEKRREYILNSIKKQGKLDEDLEKKILEAETLSELEDLYLPFKPKKKTRATIAREKGLEPLANEIINYRVKNLETYAANFINEEAGINTIDEALEGARDIIAEIINEDSELRKELRDLFFKKSFVTSKVIKTKKDAAIKYENYFDIKLHVNKISSHQVLAIFRGENEGFLRVSIEPDKSEALKIIENKYVKHNNECGEQVKLAAQDAYNRLLQPSLENEVRQWLKEKADDKAIEIFAENLKQLLLQPPLGRKRVLAIDPGFRTGCKIVILNEQGDLLHNATIYPHPPEMQVKDAISKLENLVEMYKIEAIAIGNGTASRETEDFIKHIRFKRDVKVFVVNEAGASVYSASEIGRQEFPDYDVTVRGAVSIGRRLMDPLAELVKIEPKSLGVGQYQHDVDQKKLKQALEDTVINCVNKVGVELNTASKELLTYVSGIGPSLAKKIVEYRTKNGHFKSREELKKVPGFGEKTFEQSAGFLRIKDGTNPLDATAVHPESYYVVEKMAKSLNITVETLVKDKQRKEKFLSKLNLNNFIDDRVGLPTLNDILNELEQPGRDPRTEFEFFEFDKNIRTIEDLKPGMVVPGIITNITAFGAFVDIGIHENGLIHISNLANKFVKDPNEVVKLNQKVKVKVLSVDLDKKRIQLSLKDV